MKNTIKYYYNLNIDDIYRIEQDFKFKIDNWTYLFTPFLRKKDELDELYNISLYLFKKGVHCHQFIMNINNSLLSLVNDVPYVLLKTYIINDRVVNLNDLIYFSRVGIVSNYNKLKRDDWFNLWTKKIDYLEYQVNQFGTKYPLINEGFSYFIGLAETSIILFKNVNISNEVLSVSHRRILYNSTLFDLYNPLNFIVDFKTRNVAEYFKSCFFNNLIDLNDLIYYIEKERLSETDSLILFIRILFPTYFFDCFENVILEGHDEKKLIPIVAKVKESELFLKQFYKYLNKKIEIPFIEWLS